MNKNKYGKVAVIMGGDSSEREISLLSGSEVLRSLIKSGVDAEAFDPAVRPITDLVASSFSRAILMTHGKGGEDGTLQGALELLKIPYTGSGVLASALAMDKYRTKLVWRTSGIPVTPEQYVCSEGFVFADFQLQLKLPVIVKPVCVGSTLGFTRVYDMHELQPAMELAFEHDSSILIEPLIVGDEYALTIYNNTAYPLVKIEAPAGNYDYQNKYFTDVTKYICPYNLGELGELINTYGVRAAEAIGVSGVSRLDLMVQRDTHEVFFLEINTLSGMTTHSLVPMAFKAAGVSFDELCLLILDGAKLCG